MVQAVGFAIVSPKIPRMETKAVTLQVSATARLDGEERPATSAIQIFMDLTVNLASVKRKERSSATSSMANVTASQIIGGHSVSHAAVTRKAQ